MKQESQWSLPCVMNFLRAFACSKLAETMRGSWSLLASMSVGFFPYCLRKSLLSVGVCASYCPYVDMYVFLCMSACLGVYKFLSQCVRVPVSIYTNMYTYVPLCLSIHKYVCPLVYKFRSIRVPVPVCTNSSPNIHIQYVSVSLHMSVSPGVYYYSSCLDVYEFLFRYVRVSIPVCKTSVPIGTYM
jgi:hypothetical protein